MDVLQDLVMQIDFDECEVRLGQAVPEPVSALGDPVEIRFHRAVPYVRGAAGTMNCEFLVDTGSMNMCIARAAFSRLAENGELARGLPTGITTAGGELVTETSLLHHFSLGTHAHKDLLCDADILNIIGRRYLARYNVTFDFSRGILYLREGRRYRARDPQGVCGLRIEQENAVFLVRAVTPGGAADLAGVRKDDRIVKIEGEPASKYGMCDVGALLSAAPGSQVNMTLLRMQKEIAVAIIVGDRFASRNR